MPADPIHPDQLDGHARFRADLAAYLDSLPVGELASHRQQPLQLGPLMVALNERLPDVYKLLPPAGHPGPGEGRRHSLREVVADRRAANRTWPPPPGPAERHIDPQRQADLHAERARAGAVAERRGGGDAALTPPIPTRRPAARSPVTRRPSRSATASPRTTSATVGAATGSGPTTSARPMVGRCRSGHRAPRTGCPWAATTWSATATRGSLTLGAPSRGKPRHWAGACCCPSPMTSRP